MDGTTAPAIPLAAQLGLLAAIVLWGAGGVLMIRGRNGGGLNIRLTSELGVAAGLLLSVLGLLAMGLAALGETIVMPGFFNSWPLVVREPLIASVVTSPVFLIGLITTVVGIVVLIKSIASQQREGG